MQAVRVRLLCHALSRFGQSPDKLHARTGILAAQLACNFWPEGIDKQVGAGLDGVVEHDGTQHHRNGGGDAADEAVGCGCGGNIGRRDARLQGDERRLEVWPDADAPDDLVDDGLVERAVDVEVYVEACADGREDGGGEKGG